jgi:hypothetical protein
MDIPILDGEEWWSSASIDDTDKIIRQLRDLANLCLEMEIKPEKANAFISTLGEHSPLISIEVDTEAWLKFCDQLSDTSISSFASSAEKMINDYVQKHLAS